MFCKSLFNYFNDNLKNYAGNYLEIGVYNGDAIGKLADAYPNKTLLGVDPFIEDGYTAWTSGVSQGNTLEEQKSSTMNHISGKSNVKFFVQTSMDFYSQLTKEQILEYNISCVMIDGDHHYEHVINDCMLALDLIGNKAGAIGLDDIDLPDIQQAIVEFEAMLGTRSYTKTQTEFNSLIYTLDAQ
jgi:hypothetical protein